MLSTDALMALYPGLSRERFHDAINDEIKAGLIARWKRGHYRLTSVEAPFPPPVRVRQAPVDPNQVVPERRSMLHLLTPIGRGRYRCTRCDRPGTLESFDNVCPGTV